MARKNTRRTASSSRRQRAQRGSSRPATLEKQVLQNGPGSTVEPLGSAGTEPTLTSSLGQERSQPAALRPGSLAYRRRYGGTAASQPSGDGLAMLNSLDYSYIRRDLRRIALLAGAMFAILVILSFWLR
jgi:hypothetical protein